MPDCLCRTTGSTSFRAKSKGPYNQYRASFVLNPTLPIWLALNDKKNYSVYNVVRYTVS
jgi:hypothetical protein